MPKLGKAMTWNNAVDGNLHVGAITGRYVLSNRRSMLGINVLACRLRSISPTSFVAATPVVGKVGDVVTAAFGPFGTLHGHIARHAVDGFAVDVDATPAERAELAARIDAFRERVWTGVADKRAEKRFMPSDPRSVIVYGRGTVVPCLIIDYSAAGAVVSADFKPVIGQELTLGQIGGHVVRLFDVGFAVHFDSLQSGDDVEELLAAPEEWRDAVVVVKPSHIDTADPDDVFEFTDYAY
jgi:hypothetical protein